MGVFGFVVYFIHIGNFDRHNWRNHFLLYIFQKIQEMEQLKENRRKIRAVSKTNILRKSRMNFLTIEERILVYVLLMIVSLLLS